MKSADLAGDRIEADFAPDATRAVNIWTVVGVIIALGGPMALSSAPMQAIYELGGSDNAASFLGQSFLWAILGLTLACLTFGEKLPLASIGLVRPRARSVMLGLAIGLGVYAALFALLAGLVKAELFDAKEASGLLVQWPLWLRVFAALTAGVVEEALYRGYAIERLGALLGKRWLAALISLLLFALAHVPFWGLSALATPLIGGGFFTLLYLWRRDLILCMAAHVAVDLIGVVLAPALGATS